jgi:hypothetical protein
MPADLYLAVAAGDYAARPAVPIRVVVTDDHARQARQAAGAARHAEAEAHSTPEFEADRERFPDEWVAHLRAARVALRQGDMEQGAAHLRAGLAKGAPADDVHNAQQLMHGGYPHMAEEHIDLGLSRAGEDALRTGSDFGWRPDAVMAALLEAATGNTGAMVAS